MERVLVTGVGGGVGQSVLKALAGSRYDIVAVDPDPLAAGLHAAPTARLAPRADDPSFVDRLLELCREEGCALVFPGVEPELLPLAHAREQFQDAGVHVVVSDPDVVTTCDDKAATAEALRRYGFDAPATIALPQQVDVSWYPFVLKPMRGGARAQHTYVVRDPAELERVLPLVDRGNCVVQEYLDGDEYTCGSVTFDGRCRGVIVMRRTLRAGDTYKAFVVRDDAIEEHVRAVAEALRPHGACNVQLRLHNGRPFVFEINARCSGTTAARALAGFNEPLAIADFVLHGVEPRFDVRPMTVLRYWRELAVETSAVEVLRDGGRIEGAARL